jgi:uncharacterized protein (DUF169 family)
MSSVIKDLSIFEKFDFEDQPVGVRFHLYKPDSIEKLDKMLSFCEMFKEAKDGRAFYAGKADFNCMGHLSLGMFEDDPFHPITVSGSVGVALKLYKTEMANRRLYEYVPKLAKDTVHFVSFAPLSKLSFEPDVLVFTTEPRQANILSRALSYTNGKPLTSTVVPALSCAWLFVKPYITGEPNVMIAGLGSGMPIRNIVKEGRILISIPGDLLPMVTANLREMEWLPPMFTEGKQMGKLGPMMLKKYQDERSEK